MSGTNDAELATRDFVDVLFAPYLVVPDGLDIGPWSFVPFSRLEKSGVLPAELRDRVMELVKAYEVPDSSIPHGAVVFPKGKTVGAEFERSGMVRLRRAMTIGAIANNPEVAKPKADLKLNLGQETMTVENASLYGHPIGESRSYAVANGAIVTQLEIRYAMDDEELPRIEPPANLHIPLLATFDHEIAETSFDVLGRGDSAARRLGRAMDWYGLTFSNADILSRDARVLAFRCALEVLTGAGSKTRKLVPRVERLLSEKDTEEVTYRPKWAKGPVQGTRDGMWLSSFAELRNGIAHGDDLSEGCWEYEGVGHLAHARDQLVRCLRAFVAIEGGDDLIRVPIRERWLSRLRAELESPGPETG